VARAQVVSWLRAKFAHLPGIKCQWLSSESYYPLQWRGRTGITPVSVSRARVKLCSANLDRRLFVGKRARNSLFQVRALLFVRGALLGAWLCRLELRIERRQLRDEQIGL
jgi:hypothetical protein